MLPRLVKRLDDILGKRSLLEVDEVLLEVRVARRADEDVVALLAAHERVVRDPAEGDLGEGELVSVGDGLDHLERLKVLVLEGQSQEVVRRVARANVMELTFQ